MSSPHPVAAVLFDLDGTLLDTAPDLLAAFNTALVREGFDARPEYEVKPYISGGAKAMLGYWLVKTVEQRPVHTFPQPNTPGVEHEKLFQRLMSNMLEHYENHLARDTRFFDGMETVLDQLDARGLPWGIVTNKQSRFTDPLVAAFGLHRRSNAIISGDTLPECKPHPLPLQEACRRLNRDSRNSIYIGDTSRDIEAGRRAGMTTLAALYGYISEGEDVQTWGADHHLNHPREIMDFIERGYSA